MDLKEVIKTRRSIKKFSKKKGDWRKIVQAIDSARYAPMAGNNFSLKFVLVSDEKKIQKIRSSCQQDFVDTPHVLVVLSDHEKVKRLYDTRGAGFASQQAGAAIQNILLTLTDRGLDACWVGYYLEDQIKNVIDTPDLWTVEAIIPIGFRSKAHSFKTPEKVELDNVLYFEKWKNKTMNPPLQTTDIAKGDKLDK